MKKSFSIRHLLSGFSVILSLSLLFFTSSASAAFYQRGKELLNVKSSNVGCVVERIYWGSDKNNPETDRIICQISNPSVYSAILVFHAFDSKGEYLSSFSISASLLLDSTSLSADFRTDRQIKTLKLVNVVINGNEVVYNLRLASSKIMRSLTNPPMFKHIVRASFRDNDETSQWNPEPETKKIQKKHTFDDRRSKNIILNDNEKAIKFGEEKRVHLNPGDTKKLASCEAGDLIIFRYASGILGETIEQRKSPDEKTAVSRPIIIRRVIDESGKKDESIPLNPDTIKHPQGLLCDNPAIYGIILSKDVLGSVTYRYWVIPASKVAQFLNTPAGKLISLEQSMMDFVSN